MQTERIFDIQTDITNTCNLRCKMCHFANGAPKLEVLPAQDFRESFKDIGSKIRQIGLSCGNEPLMTKPEVVADIIQACNEWEIPKTYLITNATMLNQKMIESLVDSGLTEIYISLDSHEKELYEEIRVNAKYEKVIQNIKNLQAYKKKKNTQFPILQFNTILMKSNIDKIPSFLEFINDLGAKKVMFIHLIVHDFTEMDKEAIYEDKLKVNEALDYIRKRCRELDIIPFELPDNFKLNDTKDTKPNIIQEDDVDLKTLQESMIDLTIPEDIRKLNSVVSPWKKAKSSKSICMIPSHFMFIQPNGDIRPCGVWYNEKPFGNIRKEGFEAAWNDPEYVKFRNENACGDFTRDCCKTCKYGNIDAEGTFEPTTVK